MFIAACCLIIASLASAMSAPAASQIPLPDPEDDRGWSQPCHDEWDDGRKSHCEIREFPYRPDSNPIAIHGGQNGGMTVIGWDRDDARVIYRIKARARTLERAKELASQVHLTQSRGRIQPEGPTVSRGEGWSVEVKAWVPRSSDLSLQTHNGPVGVRQVSGTMEVRSLNGPVSLIGLSGAVYARAQNGPLHVELTGSSWSGAGLDAEAQNGPVNLVVPKRYSARLETGTSNGPTVVSYPLEYQGRVRGQFSTMLGSGGPPVRVVTSNGPFRLAER